MLTKNISSTLGNQSLDNTVQKEAIPAAPRDMSYQAARIALQQAAINVLHQYSGANEAAKKQYENISCSGEAQKIEPAVKETIWKEAVQDYKDEQAYLQWGRIKGSLVPADYSDVGEAKVFVREYGSCIRYCKAMDWLWFDGKRWVGKSDIKVLGLVHEFTERQLAEADQMYQEEKNKKSPDKKRLAAIKTYRNFICKERNNRKPNNCLNQARPESEIKDEELDKDGYLLNTPSGEFDLRNGKMQGHCPEDFITKITPVTPSNVNADIWYKFLNRLTGGDQELQQYLQMVVGMAAIGKVYYEGLIIAVGEGGNGKSTFFNSIKYVLGDYAGMIDPDIFIRKVNINKSAELATLKGERLALAAELDTGKSLDSGMLKRVSSTDVISARELYQNPMDFTPSHTMIMFTNHLPQVDTEDEGTWDRLIIVPFKSRIRNTSGEIKDYASYLIEQCGGAILQWIIDGAAMFYEGGCRIKRPACVQKAVDEYREENDWLGHFLEEKCVMDPAYKMKAGEIYSAYKEYCDEAGETARSVIVFKSAMVRKGYVWKRKGAGRFYYGVKLSNAD